jgi:hypothetical protein
VQRVGQQQNAESLPKNAGRKANKTKKSVINKMGISYAYGQELRLKMKESEGGMRGNRCKMRENIVEE